jgi:hypothetical protein
VTESLIWVRHNAIRDWAREATVPGPAAILAQHGGGSGVAFAWETQLLAGKAGAGV